MVKGESLFILISKLSSNEKRHFSQKNKDLKKSSVYKKLFKILEEQGEYDREEVLERLGNGVTSKKLAAHENYLYKKLMGTLKAFDANTSIVIKLNDFLLEARILNNKGLYQGAIHLLDKAEKLALDHHKNTLLLEVLLEKINSNMELNNNNLKDEVDKIFKLIYASTKIIRQEMEYRHRNVSLVALFRTTLSSNRNVEIASIYNKTVNETHPSDGSFYSQYYYYSIHAIYFWTQQQYIQASKYQEKVILVWDNYPEVKKLNLKFYITQLANQINYLNRSQNYTEALICLEKMEQIATTNFDEEGELFQNFYFYKQAILLNKKELKKCSELIPEITKKLKKYEQKINMSRKLTWFYNIAIILWLTGEYKEANRWLQKIQENPRSNKIRPGIRRFVPWIQLSTFYMLNSYEVLESKFRSLKRNNQELTEVEKVIFKAFKTLLNVKSSKEKQQELVSFKENLDALYNDYKNTLGYEEYCLWVNQLINKDYYK